jgi:hypothetical protein
MSKMPVASLDAGHLENFQDPRVPWAQPHIGGFEGKHILEPGPYEAYNTWQMERLGARVTGNGWGRGSRGTVGGAGHGHRKFRRQFL